MPPKANGEPKQGKMMSDDVVAALLMSNGITSISMKTYELMSALDGTKTASGFQHDFRSIIGKAKDLKKRVEDGEVFVPVTPAKKRGGDATPKSTTKRKAQDNGTNETPTKKSKAKAAAVKDDESDSTGTAPAVQSPFIKADPDE